MNVTISQPRYLPHISYLARIVHSDVFIILDDVQHDDKAHQNRNRYLDLNSNESRWLTIPLDKTKTSKPILKDALIKDYSFKKKHIETLHNNYKKCKYYDRAIIEQCIDIPLDNFTMFAINHILYILKYLDLKSPQLLFSRNIETFGTSKQEKLERLLEIFKDDSLFFITGKGSMSYIKDFPFDYGYNSNSYEYKSANGEYVPYMNILDTIFNLGKEKTREMIMEIYYERD